MAAPAIKSTWKIEVIFGTETSYWFWKITNLINGDVVVLSPLNVFDLRLHVVSTTDYSFVWNKNQLHQFEVKIIDVKYIGSSGTPNYGSPSTDFASLLALL